MQNVNTGLQDLTQLGGYALQYGLHPGSTATPQTFAQANGTQPLTAKSAGLTPHNIPNTLPGAPAQPNTYLNLPGYNPNQLKTVPYKNPYFPNIQ
jgi:hypothetical protein